jgi:hypothetical protein
MVTRLGTDRTAYASQIQEKQAAEVALQLRMEKEQKKRQQEKILQKKEQQKEEEEQKKREDEVKERQSTTIQTTTKSSTGGSLVSPGDDNTIDINEEDLNLIKNLFGIMYGTEEGEGDEVNRSPPKNKAKTASINKNGQEGKLKEKNAVKGALKASFKDIHVHNRRSCNEL